MTAPLGTDLDDPATIPYFLWDQPMSVGELRRRLSTAPMEERIALLAKILREARDTDVWRFTSLREVQETWTALVPRLGRRREFWNFMLASWRRMGLLDG